MSAAPSSTPSRASARTRGPATRLDHNKVLDLWAAGLDAPTIAARFGQSSRYPVNGIICAARHNGDPRAVRRADKSGPNRKGIAAPPQPKRVTGRRLMCLALGIEPVSRMVAAAGYCSTMSGRKPVSVARLRCMEGAA